jgi:hypothetical protein
MRSFKNIRLLFIIATLVISGIIGVANTPAIKNWWYHRQESTTANEYGKPDPEQQALIRELTAWMKPFDSTNTSYYINGLLTAIDRTDSANALQEVPYTVYKNGRQLYLRMAQTEAINNAEHYLFVDHAAQRMLLGNSRALVQAGGLPVKESYGYIQDEGFSFTKNKINDREWRITMQNPHHISNKELTVQYDSAAGHVTRIFIRQAEITDPMNADKEKWISLDVRDWNDEPGAGSFMETKKFIQKKKDTWECTSGYQQYELIVR